MTLQAELLVDRRRLKRRLTLWRVLAFLAGLALIAAIALQSEDVAGSFGYRQHIARVSLSGVIREDLERQEMFEDLKKSDRVRAVILRINSPGGTTSGGEAAFKAIRSLSEKKPVVAVFSTVATSAAYMAGIASEHVVARGNTITGSVGVILQWAEVTELLDKLGIKVEEIRSGPLKAVPSPFQPMDEAGRELSREMVDEARRWFVDLVAERRKISPELVPGLTDGRIYSGRQALEHKLIDAIGGEDAAVAWLEKERNIPKGLDVVDWEKDLSGGLGLLGRAARSVLSLTGLPATVADAVLGQTGAAGRVQLDGLVSLWHAQRN